MKRIKQILFLFAFAFCLFFVNENVYAASGNLGSDPVEATWTFDEATKKMTVTSKVQECYFDNYLEYDDTFQNVCKQATELSLIGNFEHISLYELKDTLQVVHFSNMTNENEEFGIDLTYMNKLKTATFENISSTCPFSIDFSDSSIVSITFDNIITSNEGLDEDDYRTYNEMVSIDLDYASKLSKLTFENNIDAIELDSVSFYECTNLKEINFINCLCEYDDYDIFSYMYYRNSWGELEYIRVSPDLEINVIINEDLNIVENTYIAGLDWVYDLPKEFPINLIIENISTRCSLYNLMYDYSYNGEEMSSGGYAGWDQEPTPSEDDCPITTLTIDNITAEIEFDYLFDGFSALEEVTLSNVYNDGYLEGNSDFSEAFAFCTSLKKVTMDESISYIDDYMFYGCSALESIDLTNVSSIGKMAFKNVNPDVNIIIPDNYWPSSIDKDAFYGIKHIGIKYDEYIDDDISGDGEWPYGALQDHTGLDLETQYKNSGSIENGMKCTYCDICDCYPTKQYLLTFEDVANVTSTNASIYVDENTEAVFDVTPNAGYFITDFTVSNGDDTKTVTPETGKILMDKAYNVTANVTPNTNTPYTVYHHIMDTNGSYLEEATETVSQNGITGAPISAADCKDSSYEIPGGIVYDYAKVNGEKTETANIAGDGSLEIHLYYKRMPYTVTFEKGLGIDAVPDNATYYYGADVSVYTLELLDNYIFSSWSGDLNSPKANLRFVMPAKNVTLKANGKKVLNTTDIYEVNGYYYKVVIDENGIAVLTLIGSVAPATDSSVTSVTVEDEVDVEGNVLPVTSVGDNAFEGYQYLQDVNLGENVDTLGKDAFKDCTSLTKVNAKNPNLSYDESTFSGCDKLNGDKEEAVTFIGSEFTYKNLVYRIISDSEVMLLKSSSKKIKTLKVPDSVTYEGNSYSVTKIGDKAFYKLSKLKSVTIGNNVKEIGKSAFASCKKLSKVTLGKNVTAIGQKAFYKCTKLKTLVVKSSKVSSVGKNAIKGISKKAKIKVPKKKIKAYKKVFKKSTGYVKTMKIKK